MYEQGFKLFANYTSSRLYHLPPIGVGTPMVESLTGYIIRLAQEHRMTAGKLIAYELAPELQKEYLLSTAVQGGSGFFEQARMINGIGKAATDFTRAIESLTLRRDITYLSMRRWSNVIPSRKLIRSNKQWCPLCLQEWHDNKEVMYEPLLWMITPVQLCSIHKIRLQCRCPSCGKENPVLERRSKVGYCVHCQKALWENFVMELDDEDMLIHLIIAEQVGQLISLLETNEMVVRRENIGYFFNICVKKYTNGNIAEFSRLVGVPKTTVWGWTQGENVPPLEQLVSICSNLGISLVDALHGKIQESNFAGISFDKSKSKDKTVGRRVSAEVIEFVKMAAISDETPPPSMREIVRRIGFARKTLENYCMDECKAISKRYLEWKKADSVRQLEIQKEIIQKITKDLYQSGVYPSRREVEALAPWRSALRRKDMQEVWKLALAQSNVLFNQFESQ